MVEERFCPKGQSWGQGEKSGRYGLLRLGGKLLFRGKTTISFSEVMEGMEQSRDIQRHVKIEREREIEASFSILTV